MEKMETEDPKDDEDELAALMVASTTVRKRKLEVGSAAINTKRRKQLKDLAVLAPSDNASQKEREQNFAANYFNKLKEQLDEASFEKIIKLLSNLNGTSEGVINLFKEMSTVLSSSLAEEFLCFLTPAQAHLCGKLMDHLILSKMIDFFRKFEISFAKQPQMVRKFYDVLVQLSISKNVTLQQVRDAVLPLLKGKTFLMEYFLQLFPDERPPDSIVLDDFEEIHLDGDCGNEEEIRLGDTDDPANCPCSCHPGHPTHCQRCSVKYINGRVYIQIGKVLRSARVEFNGTNPMDALRRVCVNVEELTPKAKPSRRRPDPHQKDHSPVKHVSSPHMAATESEDESAEQRSGNLIINKPKSARSLKLRFKSSEKLPSKSKVSKVDDTSGEIRIITDENAIADTPECFLAKKLSPLECMDGAAAGFNNIQNEGQNDSSKQGSLEGPLNFLVHSPLKKKSICSDSLETSTENNHGSVKMDQQLLVPLKRLEDDEELLTSLGCKIVSPPGGSELSMGRVNFPPKKIESRILKSETSMNSSMSENIDSLFSSSVVNEMNLLLGSSSGDKIDSLIESNSADIDKSSHGGLAKFLDPTIDSMSIDSLLNISNLDAKIDSLLTSAESNKQLDALLNDSSAENVDIDKNEISRIKDEKGHFSPDGTENGGSNSFKSVHQTNGNNATVPSLINSFNPGLVIGNMDSLLNLSDSNTPEIKEYPSVNLVKELCEEPIPENKDSVLEKPVLDELSVESKKNVHIKNEPCNLTPSDSSENKESELKAEIASDDQKLKSDSFDAVIHSNSTTQDINKTNGSLDTIEPAIIDESKNLTQKHESEEISFSPKESTSNASESSFTPCPVLQSQEDVSKLDSVQSFSFTCGETGDENNKVTLFAAETTEEGVPEDRNDVLCLSPAKNLKEGSDHNEPRKSNCTSAPGKSVSTPPHETEELDESKDNGQSEIDHEGQSSNVADSSPNSTASSKDQSNGWTMEEDKIILQTFQKDPDMQDIFSKIKTQLPERSLQEVQNRFYVLIELMEKMSQDSEESDS